MSTTKQITLTLNGRGDLQKVIREHYLRDDIKCGSHLCSKCRTNQILSSLDFGNSSERFFPNDAYPDRHYICCDADTIVNQVDIFADESILDMIVPISVLEEVRHKSLSVYRKFRVLLNNPEKRFYLFLNEYSRHTFVQRMVNESIQDRNFRALLAVVKFYKFHLLQNEFGIPVNIVIVCDDESRRKTAHSQGYPALSMDEYVRGFKKSDLTDRLLIVSHLPVVNDQINYEKHLAIEDVRKGLLNHSLKQGVFFVNSDNHLEGFVHLNDSNGELSGEKVFVQGFSNINRAIHDDIVAVQIFTDKSQWSAPLKLALIAWTSLNGLFSFYCPNLLDYEFKILQ